MIIPEGFWHVQHFFGSTAQPLGAAVTYAVGSGLDAPTVADATRLHNDFAAFWQGNAVASCELRTTRVKAGPNDTGPFVEWSNAIGGTRSGDTTGPQVAILIEKRTTLGGRQGAGRMYLPGVADDDIITGGGLNPTQIPMINTRAATLLADMLGDGNPMFLLHGNAVAPSLVTSLTADAQLATQRRRNRR